jgi:hypothetical protein
VVQLRRSLLVDGRHALLVVRSCWLRLSAPRRPPPLVRGKARTNRRPACWRSPRRDADDCWTSLFLRVWLILHPGAIYIFAIINVTRSKAIVRIAPTHLPLLFETLFKFANFVYVACQQTPRMLPRRRLRAKSPPCPCYSSLQPT